MKSGVLFFGAGYLGDMGAWSLDKQLCVLKQHPSPKHDADKHHSPLEQGAHPYRIFVDDDGFVATLGLAVASEKMSYPKHKGVLLKP